MNQKETQTMPRKSTPSNHPRTIVFRYDENLKKLIDQRAKEEQLSINKLIIKALTLYLTKDIEDESLIIAKLTSVQRQIEFIEKKIDISQKKDMQWEQFLLALQPELPNDKAARELKIKRAGQRYIQFLTSFRDRIRALPSMFEAVLADMQEIPTAGRRKDNG
jgi:uncharacterized protein (DUF1778 family)